MVREDSSSEGAGVRDALTTGRCDLVVGSTDSKDDIRAADAVSRGEPRQEIHAGKLGNFEKGFRFNPTNGPWARKHLQIVRAGPRATGMRRPGLVRDDSRMSDSVRRFHERRLERSSNWKVAWLGPCSVLWTEAVRPVPAPVEPAQVRDLNGGVEVCELSGPARERAHSEGE